MGERCGKGNELRGREEEKASFFDFRVAASLLYTSLLVDTTALESKIPFLLSLSTLALRYISPYLKPQLPRSNIYTFLNK